MQQKPITRFRVVNAEALATLKRMKPSCVDAIVTDPPAGIAFMGKEWDDAWTYPITKHGFSDGGNRVAAPSVGKSAHNPTCRGCGKRARTWKTGPAACACKVPEFDSGTKHLEARRRFIDSMTPIFAEMLRVAKPGAHALVWAIDRTSHWTATALEDAGWEIRQKVQHVFGQGFPKSKNPWLDLRAEVEAELREAGVVGEIVWK